jgi:hypothetical protein
MINWTLKKLTDVNQPEADGSGDVTQLKVAYEKHFQP